MSTSLGLEELGTEALTEFVARTVIYGWQSMRGGYMVSNIHDLRRHKKMEVECQGRMYELKVSAGR